jgi:hypothetical protein
LRVNVQVGVATKNRHLRLITLSNTGNSYAYGYYRQGDCAHPQTIHAGSAACGWLKLQLATLVLTLNSCGDLRHAVPSEWFS